MTMLNGTHRIRQQCWRVQTDSPGDAFAVRAQLRDAWQTLLPVFEHGFDQLARDEVIHIPRLELKLRVAAGADWYRLMPAVLAAELRAALQPWSRTPADGTLAAANAILDEGTILEHYLRTGQLHWSMMTTELSHATRLSELRAIAKRLLQRTLTRRAAAPDVPTYCFRLLQLFDDGRNSDLIAFTQTHYPPHTPVVLARLLNRDIDARVTADTRLRVAAALLAQPAPEVAPVAADWSAELQRVCSMLSPLQTQLIRQFLSKHLAASTENVTDFRQPLSITQSVITDEPEPFASIDDASLIPSPEPGADPELDVGVLHAGLVLLHPFFVPLFQRTGVLQDHVLTPLDIPRAAALLHYAATGRADVHEFELGLIKVLLGLQPAAALPLAEGLLTQADTDEVNALLQSVIEHWSVLRDTSVDALRASFLQRHGLLARIEAGWRLRVEPAAFDLLLAHLPWGCSVIKLPWLTEVVHVEWTTP
ncbi:MAG TPA: contractile injection system tape measure protein [Longimicrobiales bacterium]